MIVGGPRRLGHEGFQILKIPELALHSLPVPILYPTTVVVNQDAGRETVAARFLPAMVVPGRLDQVVIQLVQVDEQGELVGVGHGELVAVAPPAGARRAGLGEIGAEAVRELQVPPEVDKDAIVPIEAAPGEVRPAAVADQHLQALMPVVPPRLRVKLCD